MFLVTENWEFLVRRIFSTAEEFPSVMSTRLGDPHSPTTNPTMLEASKQSYLLALQLQRPTHKLIYF